MNKKKFSLAFCLCISPILAFEFALLHVNDIHVRFEQTNKYSSTCQAKDEAAQKCYGGVARLKKTVDTLMKRHNGNAVFLIAGDFYQGNLWYTHFKWPVVAEFANILNFTAMAPGNHEFDDGVEGFVPFVQNVTFPMVCANMDLSDVPQLQGRIKKSIVVERSGHKIGIIGYLTPETHDISDPGKVKLTDEIKAINEEAERLKKEENVKVIIALGHSGYKRDKVIAAECPLVDVVVGGHSNSFLFTGKPWPSSEEPSGNYPTLITQSNGKVVPVVQAYAYTKYLGYMNLTFDSDGKLTAYPGKPILLDHTWPQDQEILERLKPYKEKLEEFSQKLVGETRVKLDKSREKESTLGNLFTDAMVYWANKALKKDVNFIGIMNSGGLRVDLSPGNITYADVLTVLPFDNSVDWLRLKGSTLRQMFQDSASKLDRDGKYEDGGFLQVSNNIKLVIDLNKAKHERLTSIKIQDSPLEDDQVYNVVMQNYLAKGGDGYSIIQEEKISQTTGGLDAEILQDYIKLKSPITESLVDGRIEIIENGERGPDNSAARALLLIPEILMFSISFWL